MAIYCYLNPANLAQRYWTAVAGSQPNGWILTSGSDGAPDERVQRYVAGVNNQGAGTVGGVYFDGDPGMRIVQPKYPNGITSTLPGNQTAAT